MARISRADRYDRLLGAAGVNTPARMAYARHVYHVYAVRSARRDALQQRLTQAGIQTGIHYPIPVHLQPAYADSAFPEGSFPHSEEAAREVLSLPMFAELSDAQIDEVVAAVGKGGC